MSGLNNIIRDAPFGIVGMGNNITQLADAMGTLSQAIRWCTAGAQSPGGLFFIGPAGIAFAISATVTAMTILSQKYGSVGNAVNALLTPFQSRPGCSSW